MLTLLGGTRKHPHAPVLLVVGVHREERAFGERVAARLPAARFDLLRIEHGLSGRRPGPDQLDACRRRHRALYEQILEQIKPDHRVVLDLHSGFDEAGFCADVLCADTELLRCIKHARTEAHAERRLTAGTVRGVQLVSNDATATERLAATAVPPR